ncbi:MAG: YaaR family protein [Clostridiales bacterium]|nr:YaaR family protein [Clostridiales bacterium]
MKIRNVRSVEQNLLGSPGLELKEDAADRRVVFKRTLSELGAEQHQRHMSGLAKEIGKQGKVLAHKADIKELQKYREMISKFINEMVSNSYSFHKDNSYESRRRHKVFATINKINVRLEELAQEVLSGEADNLAILDKVDDIRGLILDMLL